VDALFTSLTAATVDADSKKRPREDDRVLEAERAVKKRRQEALSLTAEATGAGDVSSSSTPAAPPMDVRVIDKGDFGRMRILGQFNLGFILAELDGDMYILDQHACDEKFRYIGHHPSPVHGRLPPL
jgi:DNA mismatch repair ATPase MutL